MTFFRVCIYLCFGLLVFTLLISFIESTGAFPYEEAVGVQGITEENAIQTLTGLDTPSMQGIWLAVTTLAGVGAILAAWMTHSVTPVGLWLFGEVFWTAWIRTNIVLNAGGYIPAEFLIIFTVGVVFLFIAAIVGMLTGSG